MKIIYTPVDNWWVGRQITCDCSCRFELEKKDKGEITFQGKDELLAAFVKCPYCFKECRTYRRS